MQDFKASIEALPPEEREAVNLEAARALAKTRLFVTLPDGSKVSLWDTYQYTRCNPEAAEMARCALVRSRRREPSRRARHVVAPLTPQPCRRQRLKSGPGFPCCWLCRRGRLVPDLDPDDPAGQRLPGPGSGPASRGPLSEASQLRSRGQKVGDAGAGRCEVPEGCLRDA
jgi:hypothetical protein